MKLLGQSKSINVRKVLWTCDELGLSPEHEQWGGDTRPTVDPDFLALNPMGMGPVLVDRRLVLTESNTICRYLADREGRCDLLPGDPAERATVESWMDWQTDYFCTPRQGAQLVGDLLKKGTGQREAF